MAIAFIRYMLYGSFFLLNVHRKLLVYGSAQCFCVRFAFLHFMFYLCKE